MEGAVLHCLLVTHLLCSVATMSQLLYIKAVDNTNETIAVMHSKVMQPEPVPQPYDNTRESLSHISNRSYGFTTCTGSGGSIATFARLARSGGR